MADNENLKHSFSDLPSIIIDNGNLVASHAESRPHALILPGVIFNKDH